MSYSLDVDPLAEQQIAALPQTALNALADALGVLDWSRGTAYPSPTPTRTGLCVNSRSAASG